MNSKRRFFSVCTALCLMLLLLAGCAAKPQPAGVGTDQPDPVQGLGLPEAGEWTVPLLTVYRIDGGEDNRVQMLYTGQWDLQKGCITTGELYETKHWAPLTPRSLPEEWQPQFIDQYDGSFTCTKDGETLRETPPEGGNVFRMALDGDTVVAVYYQSVADQSGLVTGVVVSVARYPLGHPEQAEWSHMDVGPEHVSEVSTQQPVYLDGKVYMAGHETVLAFDPVTQEVTEPLDIARLDTLWPEGKPTDPEFGYVGVAIAGCYDDVLIVNRILYAGDSYHGMDAVYKGGVLAGVILGIGRAIGETMAVIMVAGNQPRIPDSILKGVRTLTANIVIEMGYAADLHREALIATAVVLFTFILIINVSFSLLKRRKQV